MNLIEAFTNEQLKTEVPVIRIGDTVRRVSYGVGVEKTFPIHSPKVAKVEVIRTGKVRRAKLYYLRDRVGKASKVKEKL